MHWLSYWGAHHRLSMGGAFSSSYVKDLPLAIAIQKPQDMWDRI